MPGKRLTSEQVIGVLRQAEVELARGRMVGEVCRVGVSEASFYRWRAEYGGLKVDQARRMKELERENARLKRAVAELTLDKGSVRNSVFGRSVERHGQARSQPLLIDPDARRGLFSTGPAGRYHAGRCCARRVGVAAAHQMKAHAGPHGCGPA
jgi:hypothetical protein